jgi:hypothetical protein
MCHCPEDASYSIDILEQTKEKINVLITVSISFTKKKNF